MIVINRRVPIFRIPHTHSNPTFSPLQQPPTDPPRGTIYSIHIVFDRQSLGTFVFAFGQSRQHKELSELLLCYLAVKAAPPLLLLLLINGGNEGNGVARRIDSVFFCREMSLRMSLIFFSISFLRCNGINYTETRLNTQAALETYLITSTQQHKNTQSSKISRIKCRSFSLP